MTINDLLVAPNLLMQRLYEEREKRDLSLREIAERGGFANESAVARLEKPDANPTLKSVLRYAEALGVKLHVEVESMKVISFFQYAGGSSKTSATRDIGYALAQHGFRVLLIDMDPQASLTTWLGVDKYDVNLDQTVYPVLEAEDVPLPEPMRVHGMDLIPSTVAFAKAEPTLLAQDAFSWSRLRDAIRNLNDYDLVLLDTPPSLGRIASTAVTASDSVVVPLLAHSKGAEGIQTVMDMVKTWRRGVPNLKIAMWLPTQLERTKVNQGYLGMIQEQLEEIAKVATPLVRRPAVYQGAQEAQAPVAALYPKGDAAVQEIETVTSELLEVLGVNVDVAA